MFRHNPFGESGNANSKYTSISFAKPKSNGKANEKIIIIVIK